MIIRFANTEDIDKILALEEQIYKLHLKKRPDWIDETKRLFNYDVLKNRIESGAGKIFLVENKKSKIIGYCITRIYEITNHPVFKDTNTLDIEDFFIVKKYRRKGIGKKLFKEVIKYGKEKKIKFIELDVWDFNQNAKLFYKHLGMKTKLQRLELNIESINRRPFGLCSCFKDDDGRTHPPHTGILC
jgi:ribosomal protein S18 acetylase RimI-like enzyme